MLEPAAVARRDPGRMRDIVASLPDQLEDGFRRGSRHRLDLGEAERVFVIGMGGSGIAGEVFAAWSADRSRLPIQTVHDYRLPPYAKSGDVLVAMSYSGTTEETVAATAEGIKLGCRLVAVSSGGTLKEVASRAGGVSVEVPSGFPPRGTFGYQFGILAGLGRAWMLGEIGPEISAAVSHLRDLRKSLAPDVGVRSNRAKALAIRLRSRIPVIYGAPPYVSVAKRWQTQLNENAKSLAFSSSFPEADHNEIVGWSKDSRSKSLAPVFLRDPDEAKEMRIRLDASVRIFSQKTRIEQVRDEAKGLLSRLLGLVFLGDYTSLYLAALRNVDPMPVEPIEELKTLLRTAQGKD
jgi:glucose/mannose-6-phosphate isomerase